jgi:uncharacterized hydrophobic protein (TIGR00271 family)
MDILVRRRQEVAAAAAFDFAYFVYIITSACIAAAGLIINNSEIIVASMLISPIMCHINAVTFGVILRDVKLVQQGLLGVVVGTFLGALVGVLVGLYFSATMVLTDEMLARTALLSVKWSLLVAFFSALAAGVSVLHAQTGNLVGVAISTSVLPPLVNFGLLLPNAIRSSTNSVPVHACLLSAGMAIGNVLVIVLSSSAVIHVYVRLPAGQRDRHLTLTTPVVSA